MTTIHGIKELIYISKTFMNNLFSVARNSISLHLVFNHGLLLLLIKMNVLAVDCNHLQDYNLEVQLKILH